MSLAISSRIVAASSPRSSATVAPTPAPVFGQDTYRRAQAPAQPVAIRAGGGVSAFFRSLIEALKALFRPSQSSVAPSAAPAISYPPPSAPVPAPASAPAPAHGEVGPVPLEGYDYGKLHNPAHRTVKYVFGRVASRTPLTSVRDHASAEALLNSMVPTLRAAGLEIVGVKKDKIQVKTEIGYEWVDVVRGAGSGNPGWWWGSEGKGTPQPTP